MERRDVNNEHQSKPRRSSKKAGVGYFSSVEGRKRYMEAYDEAMASYIHPSITSDQETSWGNVRVYEWKNQRNFDHLPVVLLPGRSSGVPMWLTNIKDFSNHHTVLAMDALGDAGKSIQSVPLRDYLDVTGWISETLSGLGIKRAHIVGHSFGSGFAANFASLYPEQTQSLTLLEPAFVFNFPSLPTLFWASVGSLPFLPERWRNHGLARLVGEEEVASLESSDPVTQMIKAAATYYSASLPNPKTLSTEELSQFKMPVYVALGENSPITRRISKEKINAIPDVTVKIWANTTHSLPMEVADKLAVELNEFWSKKEQML